MNTLGIICSTNTCDQLRDHVSDRFAEGIRAFLLNDLDQRWVFFLSSADPSHIIQSRCFTEFQITRNAISIAIEEYALRFDVNSSVDSSTKQENNQELIIRCFSLSFFCFRMNDVWPFVIKSFYAAHDKCLRLPVDGFNPQPMIVLTKKNVNRQEKRKCLSNLWKVCARSIQRLLILFPRE